MDRMFATVAAATFIFLGTPAMAQQSGDTSGPAAGTAVKPNAATQKQLDDSSSGSATPAGAASGAAGTEAKPGSEAGAAPEKPKN